MDGFLLKSKWDYHIDHEFSISEGFKNNVNPNIISAKENLEMLKSVDNLRKCGKCSITLDELLLQEQLNEGRRARIKWISLYPQIKNHCIQIFKGTFNDILS